MTTWFAFFGFERPPFCKEIADADVWLPSSRKEVVEEIVDGVISREHLALGGEPVGSGPPPHERSTLASTRGSIWATPCRKTPSSTSAIA